jgi:hypothetical protein
VTIPEAKLMDRMSLSSPSFQGVVGSSDQAICIEVVLFSAA